MAATKLDFADRVHRIADESSAVDCAAVTTSVWNHISLKRAYSCTLAHTYIHTYMHTPHGKTTCCDVD